MDFPSERSPIRFEEEDKIGLVKRGFWCFMLGPRTRPRVATVAPVCAEASVGPLGGPCLLKQATDVRSVEGVHQQPLQVEGL